MVDESWPLDNLIRVGLPIDEAEIRSLHTIRDHGEQMAGMEQERFHRGNSSFLCVDANASPLSDFTIQLGDPPGVLPPLRVPWSQLGEVKSPNVLCILPRIVAARSGIVWCVVARASTLAGQESVSLRNIAADETHGRTADAMDFVATVNELEVAVAPRTELELRTSVTACMLLV